MPGLSWSNKMDPLFDVVPSFAVLRFCAKNQLFRKNICTTDMLMNELLKMRLHYCGKVRGGLCDVCVGGWMYFNVRPHCHTQYNILANEPIDRTQ